MHCLQKKNTYQVLAVTLCSKGYQVTLTNKVDGSVVTVNVSGNDPMFVLDGHYNPEEYEITVAALTNSFASDPTGITIDMGQIGA